MEKRLAELFELLRECRVCPRECGTQRLEGRKGICKTGRYALVSSYGPHFGEESPLVGRGGSGTIFFTFCNLKCVFCQNYDISQLGYGREVSPHELASMMLELQSMGCHNINLVSPTHVVPQIVEALIIARKKGLNLPVVYNTGGYDRLETLRLLEGIVDIYMPDFKYWKKESALKYSVAPDYPEIAKIAIKEMHRQVGDLVIDSRGIAVRGLLVRHLVLPGLLDETEEILRFLAEEISPDTYVNIMDQYRPCYRAMDFREISRRITIDEYKRAIEAGLKAGLRRIDSLYLYSRRRFF